MWMKKAEYIAMVDKTARAETRADWLLTQVNMLQAEVGALKHELTGRPVAVPMFRKEATPHTDPAPAEMSFDDVGDEEATRLGL